MNSRLEQEWVSRKEIPNRQIKDAADQYESARIVLSERPPGSGVLLPLMNTAAVAIELYLKCLSAEVIHVPDERFGYGYLVYAKPVIRRHKGHSYTNLFDEIPDDIRGDLADAFKDCNRSVSGSLRATLGEIEGAFAYTRYPFEPDSVFGRESSNGDFRRLMSLSAFLRDFTLNMDPRETIQWE